VQRRVNLIRKELADKTNMTAILSKANESLEEHKHRTHNVKDEVFGQLFNSLKLKCSHLEKTPLIFDYDLETESKNVEILFTQLDNEIKMLKPKKHQPGRHSSDDVSIVM
jgi:hypothetical protein